MVCQPGSSVATSLCEGEAKSKHVVILKVDGTSFETLPIPLKSVRPFVVKDLALREVIPKLAPADSVAINSYLCHEVDGLIEEAKGEWQERNPEPEKDFPLPLIRVRVDCGLPVDEEKPYAVMNPQRFGQQFTTKVANPRDILHYLRRKTAVKRSGTIQIPTNLPAEEDVVRVEDLVAKYLACQQLDIFAQNEFGDILRTSIEKTDNTLIEKFVKESIDRIMVGSGADVSLDETVLRANFERVKKGREAEWNRLHPTIDSVMMSVPTADAPTKDVSDDEETASAPKAKPATKATRGRGRGAKTAVGRTRGGKTPTPSSTIDLVSDDESDAAVEDDEEVEEVIRKPAARRAPALKQTTLALPKAKRTLVMDEEDASQVPPTPAKTRKAPAATAWPSRKKL